MSDPKRESTQKKKILVIDDEQTVVRLLKIQLEKLGYEVTLEATGEEGIKAVLSSRPDLVLLDLILPDLDGLEVCKKLRQDPRSKDIPIVMLTAKTDNTDEVVGLEVGADDYVRKPFDPNVLCARIKKLLKNRSKNDPRTGGVLVYGLLSVDPISRKVRIDGKPVTLTATQFRILHFLMKNAGRVFSREEVLKSAWKDEVVITDRAIDVHINGIRTKLKNAGAYIETVRGAGYRFREFE